MEDKKKTAAEEIAELTLIVIIAVTLFFSAMMLGAMLGA